jgi:uncharacterized membrane protein YkoI
MQTLSSVKIAAAFAALALAAQVRADEEDVAVADLPKAVVDAVKAKFPKAEIKEAEKEVEGGKTVYEVELRLDNNEVDVSLKPDGTILEVEKTIAAEDLPKAVTAAVDAKYPKATLKKAEEITANEKTAYEVKLKTKDDKMIEVKLDAKGNVLEVEEDEDKD